MRVAASLALLSSSCTLVGIGIGASVPSENEFPGPSHQEATRRTTTTDPSATQLLQNAEAAAANGDCASVSALAAQVRDRDGAYYNGAFLGSSTLAACSNLPEPMQFAVSDGPPMKRTSHFNFVPTVVGMVIGAVVDGVLVGYYLSRD